MTRSVAASPPGPLGPFPRYRPGYPAGFTLGWRSRIPTALLAALALVLLAAACGDDDTETAGAATSTADAASEAEFPVTVDTPSGEVTIEEEPEAIVSVSPSATEMLFAIGAGDQVVAVDDFSNYPPEAPVTDLSGHEPNVEAIASYEPDLVVLSFDPGDVVSGLEALAIPTIVQDAAASLADTYAQIEQLGQATGNVEEAEQVAAQIETDIAEIAGSVEESDRPLTYYHELDQTFYSATSSTFIGQLYALAGLESIADPADDGSGYPQLSQEFIVDADPDFVFLADTKCCEQSAQTVADRPGWSNLTAVKEGQVVELDDDIASRWGPRVVDLLDTIVDAVNARS
jgi:iron complex transport system substrate-binding protein